MKIAFITEMGFQGKVASNHSNMRTEFAWMHAMDATHFHTTQILEIENYDKVFFIFPNTPLIIRPIDPTMLIYMPSPFLYMFGS